MAKKQVSLMGDVGQKPTGHDTFPGASMFIPQPSRDRIAVDLPTDRIIPDPAQPRESWSEEELTELESRIATVGRMVQPVVVRPHPERDGYYYIKAGEGRWRVSCRLQWPTTPCLIENRETNADPRQLLAEQILENIGRVDMRLMHQARSIERWMMDFTPPRTQEEAAQMFGLSATKISRLRKLLRAPESVQVLSRTLTNINTLNYLADLSVLDHDRFLRELASIEQGEQQGVESRLRNLVQSLKKPKTPPPPSAQDGHSPEVTEPSADNEQLGGRSELTEEDGTPPPLKGEGGGRSPANPRRNTSPSADGGASVPVHLQQGWDDSLLAVAEASHQVVQLRAIEHDGLAVLQFQCADGVELAVRLTYEQQLQLSWLMGRCMDKP